MRKLLGSHCHSKEEEAARGGLSIVCGHGPALPAAGVKTQVSPGWKERVPGQGL